MLLDWFKQHPYVAFVGIPKDPPEPGSSKRPRVDSVNRLDPERGWLRRCFVCKEHKPFDGYHKNRSNPSGLQSACKDCIRNHRKPESKRPPRSAEYQKRVYAKSRDEIRQHSRDHYRTLRGRFLSLISTARGRAAKKGWPHDLDIEWALSQWEKQGGRCLLTGIPLVLDIKVGRHSGDHNPFSPSLDRIDCSLGYTKDNVRIVCVAVNIALNRFGLDVFRQIVEGYSTARQN